MRRVAEARRAAAEGVDAEGEIDVAVASAPPLRPRRGRPKGPAADRSGKLWDRGAPLGVWANASVGP